MTPYQYAANNPIFYVDVNGDSIFVHENGNTYEYRDGKLWNSDGTEYTGHIRNWTGGGVGGFLARLFNGKYKGFVGQAFSALSTIEQGGSNGAKLISDLVGSTSNTSIKHASLGPDGGSGSGFLDGTVYYDPNQSVYTVNQAHQLTGPAPNFIGMAHELGHAHDWINPPYGFTTWYHQTVDNKPIVNSEKVAGRWENLIRGEHGLPLRAYYSAWRDNFGNLKWEGPLLP